MELVAELKNIHGQEFELTTIIQSAKVKFYCIILYGRTVVFKVEFKNAMLVIMTSLYVKREPINLSPSTIKKQISTRDLKLKLTKGLNIRDGRFYQSSCKLSGDEPMTEADMKIEFCCEDGEFVFVVRPQT